ncbi:DUF6355 family natural product biosynthesis protein [Nonomuraea sp. H19]|uniref:DUF6355 family natural product biosynthesis protein n=1 Tax=Nonomuraea sp. H19 TaxID=3452206 RepID=UPI003F8AD0E9
MSLFTTMSRIALATAAVGSIALAAPAAQASPNRTSATASNDVGILQAPVGWQCGAYRSSDAWSATLHYYHCGNSRIEVEIDYRYSPNTFVCLQPWQDRYLEAFSRASHAWYTGRSC